MVHIQAGEREQAIAKFERALELNPNAGYPMMDLGEALVYDGRPQEGIAWFQKAMRLNPHHPDWFYWNLAKAEYASGQYEEAVATMKKMNAIPYRARHILAAAYVQLGRLEEARVEVKTILEINSEYSLEKLRLYFSRVSTKIRRSRSVISKTCARPGYPNDSQGLLRANSGQFSEPLNRPLFSRAEVFKFLKNFRCIGLALV